MARSKEMDLTTGNPFRSLLKFAIPVILGNLFQLFYTLADSVIVGKTLGADSLAAVGSTSIIIYFVFCFINGFTGGFGICLGQKCGAKDEKGMRKSVAVSTLLSIAFTVVLTQQIFDCFRQFFPAVCFLIRFCAGCRFLLIFPVKHTTICL